MPYITGPFRDSAGTLGEGYAKVEQTVNFEADGVVFAVPHRFWLHEGVLYEDAQHSRPAFVPLPPFDAPVFLSIQIGAETSDRLAKRFPEGTADGDSVSWWDMVDVEDPAEPIGWVIPESLQTIYASAEEAIQAGEAARVAAVQAEAARTAAAGSATTAGQERAAAEVARVEAQRNAANTRGRGVLVQPDPKGINPNGRVYFMAPTTGDGTGATGSIQWAQIVDPPADYTPKQHQHDADDVTYTAAAGSAPRVTVRQVIVGKADKSELLGFATTNSPTLTGTPTAPAPTEGSDDAQLATKGYVDATAANPSAHKHPASDIIVIEPPASDPNGQPLTLDVALELVALAADVDRDMQSKADRDSPEFIGAPTAPSPTADSLPQQIATKAYVDAALGVNGEIPNATADTKGAVRLAPTAVDTPGGSIVGTYDALRVQGWRNDFLTDAQLVAAGVKLAEIEKTTNRGIPGGYAPLNDDGVLDAAYLVNAPGGSAGGLGDLGAIRPESFTGSPADRLEQAIAAAHTAGKSVYHSGDFTLDRSVSGKNKNVRLWGPGIIRVPASADIGSALSVFHGTLDHFPVSAVRQNTFGWTGAGKPSDSDTVRCSEVIPLSQDDLAKIVSEDTWRIENRSAADKYLWSAEVEGTVLKGSHFPVKGVLFTVALVIGKKFTQGDTIVQKNSSGATIASGVVKGFQYTAKNTAGQYTTGQILLETLTGTFTAASLQVAGTTIGSIVKDAGHGQLGSVLMQGRALIDQFANAGSAAVPSLVMRRLPKYRLSIRQITFDVVGNPEDNTNRRERPKALALGNVIAPDVDVTLRTMWGDGIMLAGCPYYSVRAVINDGPNDARFMSPTLSDGRPNPDYDPAQDIGAWGYGFVKYGACDNGYAFLRGGRTRHMYTTNPYVTGVHPLDQGDPSDFALAAIGNSRDCITELFAYNCSAQAFDTHEGPDGEVLQNFYIAGSMAGGEKDSGKKAVGTRSFNTRIRQGLIVGSQSGVVFSSVHIAGSPIFNHGIVEDVMVYGYQENAFNVGNKPAESPNHKITLRRVTAADAGFAKSQPWDASAVSLGAVDTDVIDSVFGRSNYAQIRLFGQVPVAGVNPRIRIKGNDFDFAEVVNTTTNKAKCIDLSGTTGYTFLIQGDQTITPKGAGTARQPAAFVTNSGDGSYLWSENGYIESTGEAVPAFVSTSGNPTHGRLARSAFPTTTDSGPPSSGTDPNDNTATTQSITPWLGTPYLAVGDSSGTFAGDATTLPEYVTGIDYTRTEMWPLLVGKGWASPPDPGKYPNGIAKAVVNRHVGSSTTPDVAIRLLRNGGQKFVPKAFGLVTMLCGGNDFGNFHTSARGKQTYKDGLSTLAGIFRAREFVYTTPGGESGTWTDSGSQYGDATRLTVTPGSSVTIPWTGANATLVLMAPEGGTGSAYTTRVDNGAEVARTTVGHGSDTKLSDGSSATHTPVPVHFRNLGSGAHTVTIKHTGSQGDPLVVEVLLPWQDSPADMPFVIMVPPGYATEAGYDRYPDPKPTNATVVEFRALFVEALQEFSSYGNIVSIPTADIDAAMPYNSFATRVNDGLHPNKQGHKNIANAVLKTLIKYKPSTR